MSIEDMLFAVAGKYEPLLDFVDRVAGSIDWKSEPDSRRHAVEYLTHKILLHARTISSLRRGGPVSHSSTDSGAIVIDFSSAVVVTRAALETYLNLFEVFFEPKDDDLFEYRRAVYDLAGFQILETSTRRRNSDSATRAISSSEDAQIVARFDSIRERIRKTRTWRSLDKNQRKASLAGSICPNRTIRTIARAAGFGVGFFDRLYTGMSSHTHGDARSAAETSSAMSGGKQDGYFQMYMPLTMMVLSLLTENLAARYPAARAVCDSSKDDMMFVGWLVEQVIKTIEWESR